MYSKYYIGITYSHFYLYFLFFIILIQIDLNFLFDQFFCFDFETELKLFNDYFFEEKILKFTCEFILQFRNNFIFIRNLGKN